MDEPTSACGHANRVGARFCSECGASLTVLCPSCGGQPRPGARFCDACGAPLATPAPAAPAPTPTAAAAAERKQVTVLFADLAGSMDLAERFDPDRWTQIITGLFESGAEAVRRYGGTVDKFTGDGLMALFGAPVAQEDHATRAAHAALALLSSARDYAAKVRAEHGIDLHMRVGLNSGEVVAGDVGEAGFTAVGHTVGLAQRMESLAGSNGACLSDQTARLLGTGFRLTDLGPRTVKGAAEPVRVHRLEAGGMTTRRRAGTARMVGREPEWATLTAGLDAAHAGRAEVIGIVGEAGAGKSRLTEELARFAAERGIPVRRTAGISHATSVPLLPVQALFRDYFGVLESDTPGIIRARITDVMLALDPALAPDLSVIFDFLDVPDSDRPAPQLGPEARRRRILDVIRRITRARSERTTLLVILEDLHWFDPQSIAFLEAWLPSFPGTRTLVVTNFRPEFRAPWAHRTSYRQLPLPALDATAVADLVADLLGVDESTAALSADLADRAGGNPLFVEEILRGWIEDGTLIGQPGAFRLARSVTTITIPPSVQSVLAGRIDRLKPADKSVLQAAAVIGRTFTTTVLAPVTGRPAGDLEDTLHDLCAAELLRIGGAGEFQFWHPLTQEVAYGTLLNATRRRQHQAVAEALLTTAPDRHDELAGLVATHYEAAEDHWMAARWQYRAAMLAMLSDYAEAATRLRATVSHLEHVTETDETLALAVRARGKLMRLGARIGMSTAEAEQLAGEAVPVAQQLADPELVVGVFTGAGSARYWGGDLAGAGAAYAESLPWADRSGDHNLRVWALFATTITAAWTGPIPETVERCAQVLALCGDDPAVGFRHGNFYVSDFVQIVLAWLHTAGGDLTQALAATEKAMEGLAQRPAVTQRIILDQPVVLADLTGDVRGLDSAAQGVERLLAQARESRDAWGAVRAMRGLGLSALLRADAAAAIKHLGDALAEARTRHSGLQEEASLLAHLSRARLARGDAEPARSAAHEAIEVARRQGSRVVECHGQLTLAQVVRGTAGSETDLLDARAALDAGDQLAAATGARTWAAFLSEERARLDGGDLAPVAGAFDAIGATGHAARIRAELAG